MHYPESHNRWEWQLASTPEELWPLVSDTDRFNHATGVPPVEDGAAAGAALHNARRRLRMVRLGVPLEWEEEPFEWIRPRSFGVVRHYTRGPLARMRVLAELTPRPDGGTRLVYQVWAQARSLLGFAGIPVQVGLLNARSFGAAFRLFDRMAAYKQTVLDLPAAGALSPGGRARLDGYRQTLITNGQPPELVARLADTIVQSDDHTISRLRPYVLADHWGAPRQAVLKLCLWATRSGLLDFQWDLLCPSCRGAKQSSQSLRELQGTVHCEVCRIDYDVNFDRFVELTFRPNPAVREIESRPFCIGGPQVTPHIIVQQLLPPGARRSFSLTLDEGGYRVRALELPGFQLLLVAADGAPELTLRAAGRMPSPSAAANAAPCDRPEAGQRVRTLHESGELAPASEGWPAQEGRLAPHATVHLENATGAEQLLILERTMWSDQAVTAVEVITLQTFRDLFASEALRPGQQISVGSLTVVFTDLRDSTRMYGTIGDAPAFGRVMDHFEVLRAAIETEGGSVVKTIGDAVMAVFRRPLAAMRAMLAAQQTMAAQPPGDHPLVLKVGIHHGPCISVTLNERLDYFGSTVNIAARIQQLAAGDDLVVSETVWHDPEVEEWIAQNAHPVSALGAPGLVIEAFQASLKGIEGHYNVWRVQRPNTKSR